jgi:hypothetical protein
VSIDGLASLVGRLHLRQTARVAVQNAGKVHHLAEIQNARVVEQLFNFRHGYLSARSFKRSCRHTRRRTKEKLERHLSRVLKHVLHAGNAEHISDLMRVAYRRHRPVHHRRPCKLAGHEHRAFNMHMGINEAR